MRFRLVYGGIFSFLAGILFSSLFTTSVPYALFLILIGLGVLAYGRAVAEETFFSRVLFAAIILSSLGAGMLRFELSTFSERSLFADRFVATRVVVEGVVVTEPEPRGAETRVVIAPRAINGETVPDGDASRVLIRVEPFPEPSYGDLLTISGELSLPKNFETDNGREFDYVSYLKKDRIRYEIPFPDVAFVSAGNGNSVVSVLLLVKRRFMDNLSLLIPEPVSALASGIVVGGKRTVSDDVLEDFRTVGLIHIIVLSGYNLTLIAKYVSAFFSYFFGRRWTFFFATLSIILFALMTGGSATVVRASFMAFLVVLARATGRLSRLGHALLVAGFLMVLANPAILVFDPSFQLSFIATFSLVHFAPFLEERLTFLPRFLNLREIASATLATQIYVLPLLLHMTGSLSLIAPISNLLALFVIPSAMFFGIAAGTLAVVSSMLAWPFAFLTYLLLSYVLLIAEWGSRVPFASLSVKSFPPFLVVLSYVLYLGVFLAYRHRKTAPLKVGRSVA